MKAKNIKRAAYALYQSQADDKNELLVSCISGNSDAVKLVKDQGRALVVLEKLVLPFGQHSFTETEMEEILLRKLRKKGHRIQEDEEEDTPEYAEEKRQALEARTSKVPTLLGKSLADLPPKEEKKINSELCDFVPDATIRGEVEAKELPAPSDLLPDGIKIQDLNFNTLDLSNEDDERAFLEALKKYGIPMAPEKDGWLPLLAATSLVLSLAAFLKD